MKIRLTQSSIVTLKSKEGKPYWVTDEGCQNLRLYVGTSSKVWYVGYRDERGKYQNHKLGSANALTVAQAREMAREITARIAKGENPKKEKQKVSVTLDALLDIYEPWVLSNRRSGKKTINMLRAAFGGFLKRDIDSLKLVEIEKWRKERLESDNKVKASTLNRCTAGLLSVLNWAVKRSYIESNPLHRLERLSQHDSDAKVRYLRNEERKRLMEALDARETRIRQERVSFNEWRAERNKDPMPLLDGEYADYLKPMVLLSLHTGIRQNNLFSLLWGDVDFEGRAIVLRAAVSKSGKTLRLPINNVAFGVLSSWKAQSANVADDALVFPSPKTGGKFDNIKKGWMALMRSAKIENFRWHDMRHDFASQLVMKGIDLNTVRELMGHASLDMTLRYAHLAPENKQRAVEVLTTL